MNGGVYNYDYDSIGNRIEAQMATVTHAYLANSLNQYTNVYAVNGPLNYNPEYDADGNMLTRAKNVYTYDMENRLVMASNTVTDIAVTFQYDHQSRRIGRTVFNSSLITQHSSFIYDGWNLISEQITDYSGQPEVVSTNYYTWGLDLSGSIQGAGGVGGLLSVSRCGVGSQNQYYSVCDANGNITEYIDSTGTPVAHYEYDSFGSGTVESGAKADDFRFRFSSKYYGPDSGLYYYGYRYYRPKIGRWLSRDPIGIKGGLNLYGFVGNNSVNQCDKFGLKVSVLEVGEVRNEFDFRLETIIDRYKTDLEKVYSFVSSISDDGFKKSCVCWNDIKFIGSRIEFIKLLEYELESNYIHKNWNNWSDESIVDFKNTLAAAFPPNSSSLLGGNIWTKPIQFFVAHGLKNENKSHMGHNRNAVEWSEIRKYLSDASWSSRFDIQFISCYANSQHKAVKFFLNEVTFHETGYDELSSPAKIRVNTLGEGSTKNGWKRAWSVKTVIKNPNSPDRDDWDWVLDGGDVTDEVAIN